MTSPWSSDFMQRVVDGAPEGIVICEAYGDEHPVIYVNRHFEQLTGYSSSELLGADLRRLQGDDRDQEGRGLLRAALHQGQGGRALLRNYRKDGTLFWNEVFIEPLRAGDGTITHFVGYHRSVEAPLSAAAPVLDVSAAANSDDAASVIAAGKPESAVKVPGLPRWVREDRLTGLSSRSSFEDLLQLQWGMGQRDGRALTLLMFEIDSLAAYGETFGRTAVDALVRKVARLLAASFRRGTDILARWETGTFCLLSYSADLSATTAYTQIVAQRLSEMQIHHPRGTPTRFVTLSTGVAQQVPTNETLPSQLLQAATDALRRGRHGDSTRLAVGGDHD
jgi:diguanylate cyclase (GGDEF)-like protein/PAS domain S-box-containing protein